MVATGALAKSNLKEDDFKAVFLAGGGARVPVVQNWVAQFFTRTVCFDFIIITINFSNNNC